MSLRVVVAGGGTAGHIEPALTLADGLRARDPGVQITALGTARGLETRLVPARGYPLELVPPVPLPRKPSTELLTLPARVRRSVAAVTAVLDRTQADVLVGFGGYVALPAYLGARRRHVPIVVHEANARAGLANRIGARLTPFVAETVAGSVRGAQLVGLPLRASIAALDRAAVRDTAREFFDLGPDAPTLLVFGGSQGAVHLNEVITAALPDLAAAHVQVLHVVGPAHDPDAAMANAPAGMAYRALSYVDRMDLAYAAADLALCRSGAMTVAELCAVGLPAVYVPLPIGNGEQRLNALDVVGRGGALLLDDANLTPAAVRDVVLPLLAAGGRLETMSDAARDAGRPAALTQLMALVDRAAASRPTTTGAS